MRSRFQVLGVLTIAAAFPSIVCAQGPKPRPMPVTNDGQRSRVDLLRESYALSNNLVPAQRAYLLFRLAAAAAQIAPNLSNQWARDLFNLTFELDPDWNRSALQKNAVAVLASTDPTEAFRLLGAMSPLPNQTTLPEDLRADAARTVFLSYWDEKKIPSRLAAIRIRSDVISRNGQYPFAAVSPMLHFLLNQDESEALSWFSEIVSAYGQGSQNIRSLNSDFVKFVKEFWPSLPTAAKREALAPLIGNLSRPDSDTGSRIYLSNIRTSVGTVQFSSPNEQLLFEVMPLVRGIDPEWADRLTRDRPTKFRQAGQPGIGIEARREVYQFGNSGSDQTGAAADFLKQQEQLSRVNDALGTGSRKALELTAQFADSETQLLALTDISRNIDGDKDSSVQAIIEAQAKRALESSKKPADRVRALALLAQATARAGDIASFTQFMDRGLDAGELLFQEFVQAHPTADVDGAEIIESLTILVATGMQYHRSHTIARIETASDPLLASYLSVIAAEEDKSKVVK